MQKVREYVHQKSIIQKRYTGELKNYHRLNKIIQRMPKQTTKKERKSHTILTECMEDIH